MPRRLRTDGRAFFPGWQKRLVRHGLELRDALEVEVVVEDAGERYVFACETLAEVVRARRLLAREAGTIAWLRSELRAGDVLADVGANIGAFSVVAGRLVGERGHVYAFEPHPANVVALLGNVSRNGLGRRVSVLPAPLAGEEAWGAFVVASPARGSAESAFSQAEPGAAAAQLVRSTTLDALVERSVVRPPALVKVDVDGAEPAVLRGMARLLRSERRPRSLQVEVNPDVRAETLALLGEAGYEEAARHESAAARRRLERGEDPAGVAYNGVFRPARGEAGVR